MSDKAEEAGAQMLWDTPAVRLCTSEDGATVTGAIGQNADGEYIKVNASKGVLLACGDVTDDPEMVECCCPPASAACTAIPTTPATACAWAPGSARRSPPRPTP